MVEETVTHVTSVKSSKTGLPEMMTLQDIIEDFKHEFMDEVNGANKYLDEGWAADEMHYRDLCTHLCAMAKDEYSHAKFIHQTLMRYGIEIPTEEQTAWTQLEERMHQLFR
jgi:ferritin